MIKRLVLIGGMFFFVGCSQQPQITNNYNLAKNQYRVEDKKINIIKNFLKDKRPEINPTKKVARFTDRTINIAETKKILVRINPIYAKSHKKEALKEKIRVKPNAPLYIPPKFAQVIVFPYTSKDGIYHSTEILWVKVTNGEFVLNQKEQEERKNTMFGIQGL